MYTNVLEFLVDLLNQSEGCLDSKCRKEVAAPLIEFTDVFAASDDNLGRTSIVKHKINNGTIKQATRHLPLKNGSRKGSGEDAEKWGIEQSSNPWSSTVVLVKKKDGTTRFCIDFRKVNYMLSKDAFCYPGCKTLQMDFLAGSTWFLTLDLKSGYWQVEVENEDRPKTAFTMGSGLRKFCVMPFGLVNAPATFERLMEHVLAGLLPELCLIYLGDLIIHVKRFQDELKNLRKLERLIAASRTKARYKEVSTFPKPYIYIYILLETHYRRGGGLSTDLVKVQTVAEWPTPQTVPK